MRSQQSDAPHGRPSMKETPSLPIHPIHTQFLPEVTYLYRGSVTHDLLRAKKNLEGVSRHAVVKKGAVGAFGGCRVSQWDPAFQSTATLQGVNNAFIGPLDDAKTTSRTQGF